MKIQIEGRNFEVSRLQMTLVNDTAEGLQYDSEALIKWSCQCNNSSNPFWSCGGINLREHGKFEKEIQFSEW